MDNGEVYIRELNTGHHLTTRLTRGGGSVSVGYRVCGRVLPVEFVRMTRGFAGPSTTEVSLGAHVEAGVGLVVEYGGRKWKVSVGDAGEPALEPV